MAYASEVKNTNKNSPKGCQGKSSDQLHVGEGVA